MPEMDGLEATREIVKRRPDRRLRIIATADAMHGDRGNCPATGMDDYGVRPIRIEAPVGASMQEELVDARSMLIPTSSMHDVRMVHGLPVVRLVRRSTPGKRAPTFMAPAAALMRRSRSARI